MGGLWPQHAEASQRGWCNRCLAEQFFGTTVCKMFLTCCWILSWYASWTRLFLHCWGAQSRRTERCTPDYVLARPLTKAMTLTITWALLDVCRLGCAPAWCQGLLSIDLNCVHWSYAACTFSWYLVVSHVDHNCNVDETVFSPGPDCDENFHFSFCMVIESHIMTIERKTW